MKPLVASALLLSLAACSTPVAEQRPLAAAATPGDPVEGRRIARRVGCFGCHGDQLQGEEAFGDPGKFDLYSANVTQARELYDDAAFERLLRTGKTHDGHRPLGMPIKMFQNLSDQEVRDLIALVRSLPVAPNPGLKKSWWTAEARKQMEAEDSDLGDPIAAGAPAEVPEPGIQRGRHLALSTCAECHAPDLNGYPGDDAPSLIVAKAYTPAQFHTLMRTGLTAQGIESKTGLMTHIARTRLAPTLSDGEIDDIKAFLDSR